MMTGAAQKSTQNDLIINNWLVDLVYQTDDRRVRLSVLLLAVHGLSFLLMLSARMPPPMMGGLMILLAAFAGLLLGIRRGWLFGLVITLVTWWLVTYLGLDALVYAQNPLPLMLVVFVVATAGGMFGTLARQLRDQHENAALVAHGRDTALKELRESEDRYRRILENTADVIFTTDAQGRFTYVSPAGQTLTGYPRGQLIGSHFTMLVAPSWRQRVQDFYESQWHKRERRTRYIFLICTANGEERWVEQTVSMIIEDDGRLSGFHAVVRDVTERKLMEDALHKVRDEALAASRFKTQILSNISHDTRTPLNVISLYAEMVRDGGYGAINPEQHEAMTEIINAGDQLMRSLNNLLDLAQLASGDIKLEMNPFSVPELYESLVGKGQALAQEKGLAWQTTYDDALPPMMQGDTRRLYQIGLHLLDNAIKFTKSGSVTFDMVRPDDDHWALIVRDTGIGIDSVHQAKIFETFWQVDGSATREVMTGVGLGLSIVKHLTELMGGHVVLQSQPGQGSLFKILLPILPVDSTLEAE